MGHFLSESFMFFQLWYGNQLGQGISVFSVNDFGLLWQERGKWNPLSISPRL
jgi:hypothetical protein